MPPLLAKHTLVCESRTGKWLCASFHDHVNLPSEHLFLSSLVWLRLSLRISLQTFSEACPQIKHEHTTTSTQQQQRTAHTVLLSISGKSFWNERIKWSSVINYTNLFIDFSCLIRWQETAPDWSVWVNIGECAVRLSVCTCASVCLRHADVQVLCDVWIFIFFFDWVKSFL